MKQASQDQVKQAMGAVLEVLGGAPPTRVLALVDQIVVGKQIIAMVAAGQLVVGQPAPPPAAKPARKKG